MAELIDPKYRIGIDEMDAQHAQWIRLIDQFKAAVAGHLGDEQGLRAAQQTLEGLLAYTRHHFASEETFMASHGYPELESHRQLHRHLDGEVSRLLQEVRQHQGNNTPLKVSLLVTIWLLEHILKDDKGYALHVLKRAPAP